ncbi:MAG TPA: DUF1566 domain-containing protein [Thiotrichaceae bacterium]|nr:DUF1566 domain-containing protein [Thiotrichaceae bacterium]
MKNHSILNIFTLLIILFLPVLVLAEINSSSTSSKRYTDNRNGTVTDNKTGLIWLKNANCLGRQTWHNAQLNVARLGDGQCGLTDGSISGTWRLPSKAEWRAMVDKRYLAPALSNATGQETWTEGDLFLGVQSYNYWSATTFVFITPNAWIMNLYYGNLLDYHKSLFCNVWPVRDGE